MRYAVVILVGMIAGFFGAAVGMFVFGASLVAADNKDITVDTLKVTHIIVSGDIKVHSKMLNVLELTNNDGAYMEVAQLGGTQSQETKTPGGFIVRIGLDRDNPDLVMSRNGVGITTRFKTTTWFAGLAAATGIQLTTQDGLNSMKSEFQAGKVTMDLETRNLEKRNLEKKLSTLTPSGLVCSVIKDVKKGIETVKCT